MMPLLAETTAPTALISDPMALVAFFAGFVALVFLASRMRELQTLFRFVPPIVWIYLLPVFWTTFGVTPKASPLYDWTTAHLLPFSLLLLTLSTDLQSLAKLGLLATSMLLAGTLGIVIGGPISLAIFQPGLDPETWKGLGALAGSWIGGLSNMIAIKEGVKCPENIYAPMVIVDSVVGYGWMAVMILLSVHQNAVDRWNRARRTVVDDLNSRLAEHRAEHIRPLTLPSFAMMLGVGFVGSGLCMRLGDEIPEAGSILSHYTYGILLVAVAGLTLSMTPVRRLENESASTVAYGGLYFLTATMGAGGDLAALKEAPLLAATGVVWVAIHVAVLFVAMKLLRAPMFLFATGSQGNIGGVVSAPVVASVYQPALAPVGVLMGVLGNIVGTPAGLFCAYLMSKVAEGYFGK